MPMFNSAGRWLAAAAVAVASVFTPSGVAQAAPVCVDNDRDSATEAAQQPDMRELQTVFSSGTKGDAEITLRYTASMECAWGLLEDQGTIWLERVPVGSGGIDRLGERELAPREYRKAVTHTVAADLSLGAIRACGRGVDGKEGEYSERSVGVDRNGPNAGASEGESSEETRSGIQCTKWIHKGGAFTDNA